MLQESALLQIGLSTYIGFASPALTCCGKYIPAILEGHAAARSVVRTVTRARTFDIDNGSDFQGILGDAPAQQCSRRCPGKSPRRNISVLVFHIDVEPDVWILPLDFLDGTRDFHRFGGIVLGRLRMVTENGRCHCYKN